MAGLPGLELVEELGDVDSEPAEVAGNGGARFGKLVFDLHFKFVALKRREQKFLQKMSQQQRFINLPFFLIDCI